MKTYNLTNQQKYILHTIIHYLENGFIEEPIIISCSFTECEIIGIEEKFSPNLPGNLDALCDCDLMSFTYDNHGNKTYMVKQAGYDAIKNDFRVNEKPSAQLNIGAIINEMQGGDVQAIGLSNQSDVRQIVTDPQQLAAQMDKLGNELLDVVRTELATDKLSWYIKLIDDLKKEISSDKPSTSVLRRLFSSLTFLSNVEGTISFAVRVWPHIYPMLALAAAKILSAH
ncbi:MAG: hypothetical protein ACOYZ8_07755 [Chloroflexota bacterium]